MTEIVFPFAGEMPAEIKKQLTQLLNRDDFKRLRRPHWLPMTAAGKDDLDGSKYGGLPWLQEGEAWHAGQACKKPMHLFLQLNLQHLPELALQSGDERGYIQFFYCKRAECKMEDKLDHLDRVHYVRLAQSTLPHRQVTAAEGQAEAFPTVTILGWEKHQDYLPHLAELEKYGIELADDEYDSLADWGPIEVGDKLAGWPAWIQWPASLRCGLCEKEMQLLFQFEPHTYLDYSFGQEYFDRPVDLACGWIFQCDTHRHDLKFTWQCH